MAKELSGSPKPHYVDTKKKRLTWILGVSGLCILFYVLGACQNNRIPPSLASKKYFQQGQTNITQLDHNGCSGSNNNGENSSNQYDHLKSRSSPGPTSSVSISSSISSTGPLDFESHHQLEENSSQLVEIAKDPFPPCDMSYSEYTPCEYPKRGRRFGRHMLKYRERHCPTKDDEKLLCLIPPPPNYKIPFKWPQSRDYAWYDNIPHKELSIEKAVQNWIQVAGEDRFRFPGGGTMFPHGADAYIDNISALIPLSGGNIRTCPLRQGIHIKPRCSLHWREAFRPCLESWVPKGFLIQQWLLTWLIAHVA